VVEELGSVCRAFYASAAILSPVLLPGGADRLPALHAGIMV